MTTQSPMSWHRVIHVLPACAVTRAQARQEDDVIDLSNTVLFKEVDQEDGLCATSGKLITSDKQPRKESKNVELIADAIVTSHS